MSILIRCTEDQPQVLPPQPPNLKNLPLPTAKSSGRSASNSISYHIWCKIYFFLIFCKIMIFNIMVFLDLPALSIKGIG